MIEIFKMFRLGIVNLLGVIFPGILVLFFIAYSLGLPVISITLQLNEALGCTNPSPNWHGLLMLCEANRILLSIVLLIAAYVVGYAIRLYSIDDLDCKSARHVLQQWATCDDPEGVQWAKDDAWVTHCEKDDRYPYYYFKEYLEKRGLTHVASLVTWGSNGSGRGKRTKTIINMMKLDVSQKRPELSANIESNEAHVRLLFGSWRAIQTSLPIMILGAILSLSGAIGLINMIPRLPAPHGLYALWFAGDILLLAGMIWTRLIIQKLFHYQRVRELTYIVGCFWYVRS